MTSRQFFADTVRAEWIKLYTLISTWATSVIAIAIMVLFGTGLAMGLAGSPDRADQAKTMITAGSVPGMIIVAVLGVLMMTGEYASRQTRSSMMVVPRRERLLVAEALVGLAFSFILGVLSMALACVASYPFMKGHAGSLTDTRYLGLFWGIGLSFAIISPMVQGVDHLARPVAGAITVVVSVLLVIPLPSQMMVGHWKWANKVPGLLPDTLSTAVSDPFSLVTQWGQVDTATFLQHWQTIVVFAAWVIIPIVITAAVFTRHDA